MTDRDQLILKQRLMPLPRKCVFQDGAPFVLNASSTPVLELTDPKEARGIKEQFRLYWDCDCTPVLKTTDAAALPEDGEAYRIYCSSNELRIAASRRAGLMNALKTLRQLAESERGVFRSGTYIIPCCVIEDAPRIPFRALHLCWFPENQSWQLERAIRLAAYYKYNYVVLETWGVFPFESHPFLCWPEENRHLDRSVLKRIIREARELGICLIPQFNMLGHASGSRENGGKHVVLNLDERYQPLFEPDGWSWCISNPEVRGILRDVAMELLDFFDYPPYFHIGCDEARLLGTCSLCRRTELRTLLKEHLLFLHGLFSEKKIRPIMWHDMLLEREDPRWDHYIVCGRKRDGLASLYQELPKDFIIADWQYDYPLIDGRKPDWPTARFFQSEGFDTLVCPCGNIDGMSSLAKLAAEKPLFGVLQTSWADLDTGMLTSIMRGGASAWNGGEFPPTEESDLRNVWAPDATCIFHHHLRQVERDMKLSGYEATGRIMLQVPEKIHL